MDNFWMQLLSFALPGGFLGSIAGWFFSRRQRNNDFLRELQESINLLSTENKEILKENILLRRENVDLKANQEEMLVRIDRLTREVERLRKAIKQCNANDPKTVTPDARRADDGLRSRKADDPQPGANPKGLRVPGAQRLRSRKAAKNARADDPQPEYRLAGEDTADPAPAAPDGTTCGDGAEPP